MAQWLCPTFTRHGFDSKSFEIYNTWAIWYGSSRIGSILISVLFLDWWWISTYVVENNFEKNHKKELDWRCNTQNSTKRNQNCTSSEVSFKHTENIIYKCVNVIMTGIPVFRQCPGDSTHCKQKFNWQSKFRHENYNVWQAIYLVFSINTLYAAQISYISSN